MKISTIGKIATSLILLIWVILYLSKPKELEFDVKGRVAGFGQRTTTLIIEHEKIPGYMDAMTMPFEVQDTTIVKKLSIGSPVRFKYYVKLEDQRSYIEDIELIQEGEIPALGKIAVESHSFMEALKSESDAFIQLGDRLPELKFVDQDGNLLEVNTLLGRDILLTFIYTNCPVPDYCPLMSYNFKQIHDATENDVLLVSFSFDPKRDTPKVLNDYGSNYVNSFERWKFVTADEQTVKKMTSMFSVITQIESEQIIHNLRTVHINKKGIVAKIWPDNTWTIDEVLEQLTKP